MEGRRSVLALPDWLLGFGWVLVSFFLVVFVIVLGIREAKLDFIHNAEALHDRLVQRLVSNEVVLAGFSAYFAVGESIRFREVRAYARQMREQYPHIYQLEAQIRVAPSDLEAFEQRMQAAGYPDYQVRTFGYETDGRWHKVTAMPVHYPIYFMEPLIPAARPVLGLDVFSVAHLRKAITNVARTGRTVASVPFDLIEGGRAYVLFAPVRRVPIAEAMLAVDELEFPDIMVSLVVRTKALMSQRELASAGDVTLYYAAFESQDPKGWIYRRPVPQPDLLDRVLLPRFYRSVALSASGHPFILQVSRQVTWSGVRSPMLMAVFGFLVVTSLVLAFYVRARKASEGQRDEAVRALAAERDLLNRITETALSAILVFGREGKVTFANQRAENILGLKHDGKKWTSDNDRHCLFTPAEGCLGPQDNPVLRRILESGEPRVGAEHVLRCPDGECKRISINAAPLKDRSGRVSHVVCAVEDITERRRAEELLKRNEIQLREQARQLAEADRRKDDFLAMLGHELRNPLSPIRNAVAWCQRHQDYFPPQASWAKEVIARQVEYLTRLVDDLLDVSRITRGRIQLRWAPTAVADVVFRALEIVRPAIEVRDQDLDVSMPKHPLWLFADVIRLAQVVSNLLDNASKCTQAGGKLWLTVTQSGDDVVVRVRDSGIGISGELLPHIFEPFQRTQCQGEKAGGGLGLGLTLVQGLVKLHGGNITAFSPGVQQGSEFVVRLPVLRHPNATISPPAIGPHPSAEGTAKRVLVVDDEKDAALSLAMLLQTMGHETYMAGNGSAALEAATRFQPQVVILDLGLPDIDGCEIARRLRRTHSQESLLLVALTGYGQEENRLRSEQAGIDRFLTKPVDDHVLESLLEEFVPA